MGNIFSIQCGDASVGRCWDCIAKKHRYICKLEDNLDALKDATDRLTDLWSDVNRINERTPQMEQVVGWLRRAGDTIDQAMLLLTRAEEERQNLFMTGCCSKKCMSSYNFGKSVARGLDRVYALIDEEAQLKIEVDIAPAQKGKEKKHPLESNLKELEKEKEKLQALKEDLRVRISLEGGPEKRMLEIVKLWLSKADTLQAEADQLIEDGPHELNKLRCGDIPNCSFAERVAQMLEDIVSLHSEGHFAK